jgi:hypothetical protein
MGIILVIGEQVVPMVMKNIFGDSSEKIWNADKTIKYKKLCEELEYYRYQTNRLSDWLTTQKAENPMIYVAVVSCCLTVVSYISYRISNIWLMYFMTILGCAGRALWLERKHLARHIEQIKKD